MPGLRVSVIALALLAFVFPAHGADFIEAGDVEASRFVDGVLRGFEISPIECPPDQVRRAGPLWSSTCARLSLDPRSFKKLWRKATSPKALGFRAEPGFLWKRSGDLLSRQYFTRFVPIEVTYDSASGLLMLARHSLETCDDAWTEVAKEWEAVCPDVEPNAGDGHIACPRTVKPNNARFPAELREVFPHARVSLITRVGIDGKTSGACLLEAEPAVTDFVLLTLEAMAERRWVPARRDGQAVEFHTIFFTEYHSGRVPVGHGIPKPIPDW